MTVTTLSKARYNLLRNVSGTLLLLLLGNALSAAAQSIPAEVESACPGALAANPQAWVPPGVSAPAHRVEVSLPASPATLPMIRITVWRTPCPGDASRVRAWLRVSDPSGMYRDFLQLPRVTVVQDGLAIGRFGTRVLLRPNGTFQDYFKIGIEEIPSNVSFGSSGAITGALINGNPAAEFDPARSFTLLLRRADNTPEVSVEVPDAQAAGNIGFMPPFIAGHWTAPSRPGAGLVLSRNERETLFAAWMTYDDNGRATWFVMPQGEPTGSGTIEGPVYSPRGQASPNPHFSQPQGVQLGTPVGRFSFRFRDAAHAEFRIAVNGVERSEDIVRLQMPPVPNSICESNSGTWMIPQASGWGIGISGDAFTRGCLMHTTLLTYDDAGLPVWYFAPLSDNGQFSTVLTFLTAIPVQLPIKAGAVYQPIGPSYRAAAPLAAIQLGEPVGTLESVMITTSTPQFRYTIRGIALNLGMQLFRFEL